MYNNQQGEYMRQKMIDLIKTLPDYDEHYSNIEDLSDDELLEACKHFFPDEFPC